VPASLTPAYHQIGHRIAEHVDLDGDGDVDADDPWTRLVYDARWRVVATYRIDAVQDTEALHERFIYHAAGLDGVGTGSYQQHRLVAAGLYDPRRDDRTHRSVWSYDRR